MTYYAPHLICLEMSQPNRSFKVAVLGAAGGIGQPVSLLLKQNTLVGELSLYDVVGTAGVAADLSHINTSAKVGSFLGDAELDAALLGCDVVLITAGKAQQPGDSREVLFSFNASILKSLAEACSRNCPFAMVCIVSNPVNSLIPIASEVFKKAGVYDPRRIFGINTLDVIRSNTFVAEAKSMPVSEVVVPVIGGHSQNTILPLLSQTKPPVNFSQEEIVILTDKIQDASNEVINKKAGRGSATLSTAYAATYFVSRLMEAMNGKEKVVECAFVKTDKADVPYMATPLLLGADGVSRNLGTGELSEFEKKKLHEAVIPELLLNIKTGEDYFRNA